MIAGLVLTTLRLYRAQIVVTAALIVVLAAAAVVDGRATASFIADFRSGNCPTPDCDGLAEQVGQRYQLFGQLLPVLGLLPAAIGAFWGAPLVGREFETGTAKVAWTQSVSRRSWILTRLIVLGSLLAIGGLALGIAIDSWLSAFSGFGLAGADPTDFSFTHMRGTAPVGWWLFGFTLGAACGAFLRRTLPAMAVTGIVMVVAIVARNLWFGSVTEGLTVPAALGLQHLETATLVAVAVVVSLVTTWSVQHANA